METASSFLARCTERAPAGWSAAAAVEAASVMREGPNPMGAIICRRDGVYLCAQGYPSVDENNVEFWPDPTSWAVFLSREEQRAELRAALSVALDDARSTRAAGMAQRIYGKHGTAEVEISVDYDTAPPTIARYDIVGDVYESASELAAADKYHAAARWISGGYDVRNGGMTEAHGRDLHCAAELAFDAASKQWRVFRRRLAEANAAWSESIRREEAEALAERNREAWREEQRRNEEARAAWVRAQEEAGA